MIIEGLILSNKFLFNFSEITKVASQDRCVSASECRDESVVVANPQLGN